MGILSRWKRPIVTVPNEERGINPLIDYLTGGKTASGQNVTGLSAMRVATVFACVRVLSETVAQLPLEVFRRMRDGSREPAKRNYVYRLLHDRPNSWQTSFEFREQMMMYLLLRGNAYADLRTNGQLIPIHPDRVVKIERNGDGTLIYTIRKDNQDTETLVQQELMHIRGQTIDGITGLTPISYIAETIGRSMSADEYAAATYKNGAKPTVVLETDAILKPNAAERMRKDWQEMYGGPKNAGKTAVLEQGVKAKGLQVSNVDMQFIESQKWDSQQIAAVFRVPMQFLNETANLNYSNGETMDLSFTKYTIGPWLQRWEQAIQRDLLDDDTLYAEHNVEGLLRGDSTSRAQWYREMFNIGVISPSFIAKKENFPAVPDGDKHMVNSGLTTLEMVGKEPPAEPLAAQQQEQQPDQSQDPAQNRMLPEKNEKAIEAANELWMDAWRSMRNWEADKIATCAKKPSVFLSSVETFLDEHEARTANKLEKIAELLDSLGIERHHTIEAKEHRAAVWAGVLNASDGPANELVSRVDLLCEKIRQGVL